MPNPLIYASTTPSHSLHKGDVAVGVNSVEYGPTSTTGWYNGIVPTENNYVIYKTSPSGDPDVFAPQSDAEFYRFITMQGGSSSDISSIEAALAWIATQSNLLAFRSSLPNIVTDGLVLALDAQQISSYPTTGSTWYDLSGNGDDGTLINGPTFDSNGAIVFDGVDNYIIGTDTHNLSNFTAEVWVYPTTSYPGGLPSAITTTYPGTNSTVNYNIGWYTTGDWVGGFFHPSSGWNEILVAAPAINTWHNYSLTYNGTTLILYHNGVSEGTLATTNTAAGGGPIRVGRRWDIADYFPGNISNARVYNRALTSDEILQNYYQAPIITDGLILALDAGNLGSYESGSTTTYSMTGSDSGSLNNGVAFNNKYNGGWDLDGTNDYISLSSTQIPATTDWTYSCWFNVDTLVAGGVLYGQYLQQGGNGRVLINLAEEDYSLCIRILSGTGYGSQVISSAVIPTVGENYNFAISRNGQTYNLYVDGVLEQSTTTAFTASFLQTTPIIGGRTISSSNPTPTQNFFDGTIYDLKFYDTALSDVEIQQNYQAQSSRFI